MQKSNNQPSSPGHALKELVRELKECFRGSLFTCGECGREELYTTHDIVTQGIPVCACNDCEMTLEIAPESIFTNQVFEMAENIADQV